MSRISQIIEALEAERADAEKRLAWIEQQIAEFRKHNTNHASDVTPTPVSATTSSARGGKARSATRTRTTHTASKPATKRAARKPVSKPAVTRAATATAVQATPSRSAGSERIHRGDVTARIVTYLNANPGSTAGDVAKALGLKPNSTSTRLSQMAKGGEVKKAKRGYAVN